MQSLEVLPVFPRDRRVHWLRPEHAGSLRLGWPAASQPAQVVTEALAAYEPEPFRSLERATAAAAAAGAAPAPLRTPAAA